MIMMQAKPLIFKALATLFSWFKLLATTAVRGLKTLNLTLSTNIPITLWVYLT